MLPPKVLCAAFLLSFALLLAWAGCGGDDKPDTSDTTPSGEVCPDAIDGSGVWSYDGDDAQCKELAALLTAQGDDEDPTEAEQACAQMLTAFALEAHGAECHAELVASCDTRTMQISCVVDLSGGAMCTATIRAPELDPGPCVLELVIA